MSDGTIRSIPFGKYQDTPLTEVPADYLQWILGQKPSTGIRAAVAAELQRRGLEPPPPPSPKPPPACDRCGHAGVRYGWIQQRDGRKAIRQSCAGCGGSLGTAPLTEENIRQADQAKGQGGALALLAEAGQRGIRLTSDGVVADIAAEDWRLADDDFKARLRAVRHDLGKLLGKRS